MLFSTLQLVLETHRSLSQFCISCGGLPMLHALQAVIGCHCVCIPLGDAPEI